MNIEQENIYFVGIGGIGMSALARYFHQMGKEVAGYDRAITDLSKRLQAEGIAVNYILEADAVPFSHRDKENTLVVYTPAIAADNEILTYFQEEGFECIKRASVLGRLSQDLTTIAVAGTHGKTTVSSMIAFILHSAGIKLNAFLGGISHDFRTNLLLDPEAEFMLTEADEYDRSFLQLHPHYAVITAMDADHLDIYEDEEQLLDTYIQFTKQIKEGGVLFTTAVCSSLLKSTASHQKIIYAGKDADVKLSSVEIINGVYEFDLAFKQHRLNKVQCGLPGRHNLENAAVAIAVALSLGVDAAKIKDAIGSFRGVKRRFDVHIKRNDFVYIDDYAHHPLEIKALLASVKELYPSRHITAVFQPHLYSRTKDFGTEFAHELAQADEVILLELYPAREKPIDGIDARWLAKQIDQKNVHVLQKNQLIKHLQEIKLDVLLTVGAGDIDAMVEPIIKAFEA